MQLFGITGTDGAGKGTVVEYLKEQKGFRVFSARELLLEELRTRELPEDRPALRLMANELRRLHGNDFFVRASLLEAQKERAERVILDSIRALAEAELLKKEGGKLLAVDADQKIRFTRIEARASTSDHIDFETFKAQEELEMHDSDPNGMQKAAVMRAADFTLTNNTTREELFAQVEKVLGTCTV